MLISEYTVKSDPTLSWIRMNTQFLYNLVVALVVVDLLIVIVLIVIL